MSITINHFFNLMNVALATLIHELSNALLLHSFCWLTIEGSVTFFSSFLNLVHRT